MMLSMSQIPELLDDSMMFMHQSESAESISQNFSSMLHNTARAADITMIDMPPSILAADIIAVEEDHGISQLDDFGGPMTSDWLELTQSVPSVSRSVNKTLNLYPDVVVEKRAPAGVLAALEEEEVKDCGATPLNKRSQFDTGGLDSPAIKRLKSEPSLDQMHQQSLAEDVVELVLTPAAAPATLRCDEHDVDLDRDGIVDPFGAPPAAAPSAPTIAEQPVAVIRQRARGLIVDEFIHLSSQDQRARLQRPMIPRTDTPLVLSKNLRSRAWLDNVFKKPGRDYPVPLRALFKKARREIDPVMNPADQEEEEVEQRRAASFLYGTPRSSARPSVGSLPSVASPSLSFRMHNRHSGDAEFEQEGPPPVTPFLRRLSSPSQAVASASCTSYIESRPLPVLEEVCEPIFPDDRALRHDILAAPVRYDDARLYALLMGDSNAAQGVSFAHLFPPGSCSRRTVSSAFFSLLELVKKRKAKVTQERSFGSIVIKTID